MTQQIPIDRRLTEDERAYLLMRGEDSRVKGQDERYPAPVEDDESEDAEEVADYNDWTVAELQTEIRTRNDNGAEIKPTSQKKDDLVAALEADDEAAEQ